jgi:Domain of unknown function (DUF4395)
MPNAIPAGAESALPPAGKIDPRGMRFGAGISAILLIAGFLTDARWVVPVVLLSLGVSAAFGMRYSIYGIAWKRIVPLLKLGKAEPEHEYPPRFAQTLGSIALTLSLLSFIVGLTGLGWLFALAVAALQTLLAVTGYCLGCRLYFLRWWLPSVATSFWTRGRRTKSDGAFGSTFSPR